MFCNYALENKPDCGRIAIEALSETAVAGLATVAPDCRQRSQDHHHDPIVLPSHSSESIEGGALEVNLHQAAKERSLAVGQSHAGPDLHATGSD